MSIASAYTALGSSRAVPATARAIPGTMIPFPVAARRQVKYSPFFNEIIAMESDTRARGGAILRASSRLWARRKSHTVAGESVRGLTAGRRSM